MKQELAYLRQRVNQEIAMAAASTSPAAKRAHDALADAYYAKVMELQSNANRTLLQLLD